MLLSHLRIFDCDSIPTFALKSSCRHREIAEPRRIDRESWQTLIIVFTPSFTKLPWTEESKVIFRSWIQGTTCCPPVYHIRLSLWTVSFYRETSISNTSCEHQFLIFGLTRRGIEPILRF